VDPLTLLALAAAAGFVFKKVSSQAKENNETDRRELTYSRDIVARAKWHKLSFTAAWARPIYVRAQAHYRFYSSPTTWAGHYSVRRACLPID
jgi:hypothetical protein